MAVPRRAQLADGREPSRAGTAEDRAGRAGLGRGHRFRPGRGPGPAAPFRRVPASVARAPERAPGDLLPGRDHGGGRSRARHTARDGQVAAALRARCAAPGASRARRDRALMTSCLPPDGTVAGTDGGAAPPAGDSWSGRYLIAVMLVTAAALDLTRCGLVMAAARHPGPTAWLVTAGLAAAALTARTARGCRSGRRWAGWAALLIGAASPPQAAASGFHGAYAIPDTATAVLGILLAVTILATAGQTERQTATPQAPAPSTGGPRALGLLSRVITLLSARF